MPAQHLTANTQDLLMLSGFKVPATRAEARRSQEIKKKNNNNKNNLGTDGKSLKQHVSTFSIYFFLGLMVSLR